MLDWSSCAAVERIPEKVGGEWLFKGTRVPVKTLIDYLQGGHTLDEFLEHFPSVSREQAEAVLELAKRYLVAQAT